jgi:hypothetical protein
VNPVFGGFLAFTVSEWTQRPVLRSQGCGIGRDHDNSPNATLPIGVIRRCRGNPLGPTSVNGYLFICLFIYLWDMFFSRPAHPAGYSRSCKKLNFSCRRRSEVARGNNNNNNIYAGGRRNVPAHRRLTSRGARGVLKAHYMIQLTFCACACHVFAMEDEGKPRV